MSQPSAPWRDAARPARPRRSRPALRASLGAGLIWLVACSTAPPPAGAPSGPLRAVAPKGAADWPITFSWEGVDSDAVVRVRIYDEAERAVHGIEARGTAQVAPAELRRLLEPGATYLWRVARVDENGEETDASELTAFSLR